MRGLNRNCKQEAEATSSKDKVSTKTIPRLNEFREKQFVLDNVRMDTQLSVIESKKDRNFRNLQKEQTLKNWHDLTCSDQFQILSKVINLQTLSICAKYYILYLHLSKQRILYNANQMKCFINQVFINKYLNTDSAEMDENWKMIHILMDTSDRRKAYMDQKDKFEGIKERKNRIYNAKKSRYSSYSEMIEPRKQVHSHFFTTQQNLRKFKKIKHSDGQSTKEIQDTLQDLRDPQTKQNVSSTKQIQNDKNKTNKQQKHNKQESDLSENIAVQGIKEVNNPEAKQTEESQNKLPQKNQKEEDNNNVDVRREVQIQQEVQSTLAIQTADQNDMVRPKEISGKMCFQQKGKENSQEEMCFPLKRKEIQTINKEKVVQYPKKIIFKFPVKKISLPLISQESIVEDTSNKKEQNNKFIDKSLKIMIETYNKYYVSKKMTPKTISVERIQKQYQPNHYTIPQKKKEESQNQNISRKSLTKQDFMEFLKASNEKFRQNHQTEKEQENFKKDTIHNINQDKNLQ